MSPQARMPQDWWFLTAYLHPKKPVCASHRSGSLRHRLVEKPSSTNSALTRRRILLVREQARLAGISAMVAPPPMVLHPHFLLLTDSIFPPHSWLAASFSQGPCCVGTVCEWLPLSYLCLGSLTWFLVRGCAGSWRWSCWGAGGRSRS
jgi:hypothetical protein